MVRESGVHLRHHVVGILEEFTMEYYGTSVPVCCSCLFGSEIGLSRFLLSDGSSRFTWTLLSPLLNFGFQSSSLLCLSRSNELVVGYIVIAFLLFFIIIINL